MFVYEYPSRKDVYRLTDIYVLNFCIIITAFRVLIDLYYFLGILNWTACSVADI